MQLDESPKLVSMMGAIEHAVIAELYRRLAARGFDGLTPASTALAEIAMRREAPAAVGDPVPLSSARLLAPIAQPPTIRDYMFEEEERLRAADGPYQGEYAPGVPLAAE